MNLHPEKNQDCIKEGILFSGCVSRSLLLVEMETCRRYSVLFPSVLNLCENNVLKRSLKEADV